MQVRLRKRVLPDLPGSIALFLLQGRLEPTFIYDGLIVIKIFEGFSKNYCYIMMILKTCFSGVTRYNYFIKYMLAGQRNLSKENLSEKELEISCHQEKAPAMDVRKEGMDGKDGREDG